ncbi:MAG: DNA translocase FtsK [Veillonellaceae bacterium]|nr:DNA translocase FtsK [Veillonellaceae bacterium]
MKKDHSLRNYELMGIVLAAVGIICLCGIVGLNVGFVGLKAAKFLQYFFGIGAMPAAAVFVGLGGYYIMKHTKLHWNTRMVGGILFYACGLGLYHHWVVKEGAEILPENLVDGGGLLGGLLTLILHKVVGTDGTPVLLGAGLLGSALVVTTWSLAKGILTTKEKAEQGAQVAKKATVVAYDKTLEVGTKAKEQVQEYVQEHVQEYVQEQVQSVGEKLQKLKGREFLSRYEEESAFLNRELSETQKDDSLPGSRAAEKSGKLAQMPNKIVQKPKATGNNLVDANPVAANFFGAEFASDVEPEDQVPSLASQLGISEEELHPEMEQVGASNLETDAAVDNAPNDNSRHDAIKFFDDIVELDLSAPIGQEKTEAVEAEPEFDTTVEDTTVENATDEDLDWDSLQLQQPEYDIEAEAYDYGLDDMDISYSQDSVDITENVPDDSGEIEEPAVQEFPKPAVSTSVANPVSNTASAAAVGNLSKTSIEIQPPPPPYILPSLHLLSKKVKVMSETLNQEIAANARILGETLANFKVKASILNACHGPAVTRYEVKPAPGVKVSKITGLADDIALNMAASAVRIEQIPGKAAIGIEVPNQELESVQLREVLENPAFAAAKSRLTVGLGKDISGQAIFADLAKMPHLLVAGATGSGKSVCINTLITSILFKAKPTEVKFILIDPKMVELSVYNDIPHLMVPVVTDAKKAASVLNWAVQEMEKRYGLIAQAGVRNMDGYNKQFEEGPEKKLPSIVIIIDELADLMMVAPHDVEDAICRIAQKARAAGIYLVLATQRPSVNVITGVIKANIPSRISFAVTSQIDSRTILDASGAEKLLGKGDMLFKPQEANKATRIQGAFVSDKEVELLVEYIKSQGHKVEANQEIIDFTNKAAEAENEPEEDKPAKTNMDSLLREAVELVMSSNNASASSFQRRYHIGYSRAGRLLDTMEQLGIVGPPQGSKPRDILVTEAQAFEIMDNYESQ